MDFISDASGRYLARLLTLTEPPDFVKASSILPEDVAGLHSHQFADAGKREFPIDTPGHVWASYGFCLSADVDRPDLLGRIKSAAEKFGIAKEIETIDVAFAGLEKQAAAPEVKQYAVHIDLGAEGRNGKTGVQGFYPISTEDEVVKSASVLVEHRGKIPLECFAEGARSILKRANDLGVAFRRLPQAVVTYGTVRLPDFDFLKYAADQRVKITNDNIYREIVATAEHGVEGKNWEDFVEMWKQADDLNGVLYTKSVWDPYRIFNTGVPEEHAEAELEKWASIAGAAVPVDEIAKFPVKNASKFFPRDIAAKVIELVKQAANAPGSVVTELAEQLDESIQRQFLKLLTQ